jgi:hypothetical protein
MTTGKRLILAAACLLGAFTLGAQDYYTGDGGKGISLTVLAPEGKNLADNDGYLPDLVQSVLSGDFTKYSAMSVMDWQSLSKVLKETENMVYAESGNVIAAGKITQTQFILNGTLMKLGDNNFSLQLKITDTQSGANKASYTGNSDASGLTGMTAIRAAAADLLGQMGVSLTAKAKEEIAGVNQKEANAQTAIAKGAQAQRGGTVVEAMSYYFEAAAFDPSLLEATTRLAAVSSSIAAGNIGENVRNDIQRRKQWKNIIDKADAFYKAHPPVEIIYDPTLTQGKIDYQRETVELSFFCFYLPDYNAVKIIQDITAGLEKTGRNGDWKLRLTNYFEMLRRLPDSTSRVSFELKNSEEKVIGEAWTDMSRLFMERNPLITAVVFRNVNANDITDTMSVNVVRERIIKFGNIPVSAINFLDFGIKVPRIFSYYLSMTKGDFQFFFDTNDVWVGGYTGSRKEAVIPASIGRWTVTGIEQEAFDGKKLTSVIIPSSVRYIKYNAFYGNSLTSIVIPANVSRGDSSVFDNGFDAYYDNNGKKAGTYILNKGKWTYRP